MLINIKAITPPPDCGGPIDKLADGCSPDSMRWCFLPCMASCFLASCRSPGFRFSYSAAPFPSLVTPSSPTAFASLHWLASRLLSMLLATRHGPRFLLHLAFFSLRCLVLIFRWVPLDTYMALLLTLLAEFFCMDLLLFVCWGFTAQPTAKVMSSRSVTAGFSGIPDSASRTTIFGLGLLFFFRIC